MIFFVSYCFLRVAIYKKTIEKSMYLGIELFFLGWFRLFVVFNIPGGHDLLKFLKWENVIIYSYYF
jgi:hypothetical protein